MKILNTNQIDIPNIIAQLRSKRALPQDVTPAVKSILESVAKNGDIAVRAYTKRFDGITVKALCITRDEISKAYRDVDKKLLRALQVARRNITKFHKQTIQKKEPTTSTCKGVQVWREFRPIERVGLYVPGGLAAYPSTVLMLAVPAKIAGCKEVIICTPAGKNGNISSAVLVAADLCGVGKIYKVGGAQAIAAMAYGTKSIPKVQKIFGPGNQYVTTAKMLVYGEVDIDMPAGPSEIAVIADQNANPKWIAADLLSQLEHGTDSQAVLLTTSKTIAQEVIRQIKEQMQSLTRREIIAQSLTKSFAIIVRTLDEACDISNRYAPEHLEIVTTQPKKILKKITNAGSVFLGPYASEPLGDYATGANHTLPTSGYAANFSPLSTSSFGKMMQVQKISLQGITTLQETVETLAQSEGLDAHKNAITIRFS